MKKQELQKMVKSIFSDSALRARFVEDPRSVMAGYVLTPAEKKAVLSPRMKLTLTAENQAVLADEVLDSWF